MCAMNLTDWPVLRGVQPYILKSTRMVYVFGKDGGEALLVTHEDRVYAIGKNDRGCLGLGDLTSRSHETEVKALSGRNVKGFTSGGNPDSSGLFVIAYLQDGKVYQWGSVPGCENPLLTPQEVQNLKHKVVHVACGISHCVALCQTGEVYSWGTEDRGKLGRPTAKNNLNSDDPIAKYLTADRVRGVLETKEVVKIACGAHFTVVALKDDTIVTWGCNEVGQLGLKRTDASVSVPSEIQVALRPHKIELLKLVCGPDFVYGLKVKKEVEFWGNNRSLKMFKDQRVQCDSPTLLTGQCRSTCSNVVASYLFSLAVIETSFGLLYFGENVGSQVFPSGKYMFFKLKTSMCGEPWFPLKQYRTPAEILASTFDYSEKSDLTIRVEEKEIYVHKFWLMIRSVFFAAMIQNQNGTAECDTKVLTITGYTYEVIYTYLKFLYIDDLAVDFNLAVELFKLADEYVDDDLKIKCVDVITKNLTAERVNDVYPLACKFQNAEKLMELCVDLASKNLSTVVNSPKFNWDGDVARQFLRQMAKQS